MLTHQAQSGGYLCKQGRQHLHEDRGWTSGDCDTEEAGEVDCGQGLQELEAIKLKLWALEQAKQRPEPPSIQGRTRAEDGTGTGRLLSSPGTTGCPFPGTPKEKVEADHRSIYVGNQVDYGGTARELEAHFHHCGQVHRVTILCDKFSGHPKGYAYIEFATESSAQAAMELDESIFRGRVIKVPVSGVLHTSRPPSALQCRALLIASPWNGANGHREAGHLPKDTQLSQPSPLCVPWAGWQGKARAGHGRSLGPSFPKLDLFWVWPEGDTLLPLQE
nr:embryonic polyadenylate-binding protein 2 isoform X1 [Marmota flaviventris]